MEPIVISDLRSLVHQALVLLNGEAPPVGFVYFVRMNKDLRAKVYSDILDQDVEYNDININSKESGYTFKILGVRFMIISDKNN